jgi:hypothetical protein
LCLLVIRVLWTWGRALRSSLLILMWYDYVSHRSNVRPKYLVDWEVGIWILLRDTSGQGGIRRVKVVWSDLEWLTLKCHFLYQSTMSLRWNWRLREAICESLWIEIIALSSANPATNVLGDVGWSAAKIYKIEDKGHLYEPLLYMSMISQFWYENNDPWGRIWLVGWMKDGFHLSYVFTLYK